MITYFPEPYEDELAYSLFARYYMKSGYTTLLDVMDELYVNKWYRADTMFLNKLKPDAIDIITRNISIKQFIEKHTMFPYYARFIKKDRRDKALKSMVNMDGNAHNLLPINNGTSTSYLRYCTLCAEEDRRRLGETYWHRIHQLQGVDICPVHGCILHNSHVPVAVKTTAGLVAAEIEVPMDNRVKYSQDNVERMLASYVAEVFWSVINYESDGIGSFLRERLDKQYFTNNGLNIKIGEIIKDTQFFYGSVAEVGDMQRIQKIYNGYRWNPYEICQLAFFQNISVNELVNYKNMEAELLRDTYLELATKYNMDYAIMKALGNDIIHAYKNLPVKQKSGVHQKKWAELDKEYLVQVKDILNRTINNHEDRPVKITAFWMCKQLGINAKQIDKLPKCKAEIEKHAELQEQYWAREIVWAVNLVDTSGTELCWRRIRELTNIRKVNLIAALPYVKEIADYYMYERINQLL